MAGNDVKVLGYRASPFVNRVQFALNLKSIDYEFLPEINYPAKSELLLKLNPVHKKIPVLIHADKPVCESLVIIQYIDETWPENGPSILPSDPHDRATARFWADYIDNTWHEQGRHIFHAKDEEHKAAICEKIFEGTKLLEDVFVKSSKGKAFFGGDDLGYLDIVLGSWLAWGKVGEITTNVKIMDRPETPGLAAWAEAFMSHRAVKGTVLETHELLSYLASISTKVDTHHETPK